MDKPTISFTSGCVINLDDIQDFPDYCQVIGKLLNSIKSNKIDYASLTTILDAEIQDIQHIPQFKQLLPQLTTRHENIFNKDKQNLKLKLKFIKMMLRLAKNYFTSFTMDQEQAAPIVQILRKQMKNYPAQFCDFWLAISKFAPYVEKHQEIVGLFLQVVNQQEIFLLQQLALKYVKSVDKILRFKAFRKAFNKVKQNHNPLFQKTPFLDFKIACHQNKGNNQIIREKFKNFIVISNKLNEGNGFMHNYISNKLMEIK